jgi:hypothetical protein
MSAWSTPEGCDPFRASVGPQWTADAHPRDRRAKARKWWHSLQGLLTSSLEALHPPPKLFNCTSALRCAVSYHHKPCPPATLSGNYILSGPPPCVRANVPVHRYQFGSRRLSVDPAFASTEVSPGSHKKTSKAAYDVCTPQSCYSGSSMDGNRDSFGLDCPPDVIPRARNALNKRKCPAACVRACP